MLKLLVKTTDAYKNLPRDVKSFTIEKIGSSWYIKATFDDREPVTIGRHKTETEAKAVLEIIKNITNSNND